MPTKRRTPSVTAQNVARVESEVLKAVLDEYVMYLRRPMRVLTANFLAGLARGIGFVLGATVLVTLLVTALAWLGTFPYVGEWFRWLAEQLSAQVSHQ